MIKGKKLIGLIAVMILLASCKKNEIEDIIVNEPAYFVEGTVDGEELLIIVGPDNIVAETSLIVSDNSLPIFSADFHDSNCPDCSEQLTIEIVGDEEWDGNLSIFDYLPLGNYPWDWSSQFSGENEFNINFTDNFNLSNYTIFQFMGGEEIYSGNQIPSTLFLENGSYNVLSLSESDGGCTIFQNSSFEVVSGEICSPDFEIFLTEDTFSYTTSASTDNGILFSINGAGVLLEPGVAIALSDIIPVGQPIKEIALLEIGSTCPSFSFWNFEECNDLTDYNSSVSYSSSISNDASPLTARLRYINSSGDVYRSAPLSMGGLEILDIVISPNTNNGELVYDLLVNIDAELLPENVTANPIHLIINNGVIPISF